MLEITVLGGEFWDEENERFVYPDSICLQFEHSLVSLSKWESIHHKIFLTKDEKTQEETLDYIWCMLLTPGLTKDVFERFSEENFKAIDDYINNPMTGTTVTNVDTANRSSELISSELIYYWMAQFQIDKECEEWHLNRLFTLIRVHHAKSQKPKKMSPQARAQSMAEVNAARKKRLGTSG